MMAEIDFKKLGIQVIKRAIKDALINENKFKTEVKRKQAIQIKNDAIKFLTKPNEDLELWCLITGLDYVRVLRQTKKVTTNPNYWKNILKILKRLEE